MEVLYRVGRKGAEMPSDRLIYGFGGVNPKVPETASQRNIMPVARRLHIAAAPAFSVVLRNVYFVSYMCMIRQFWSVVFQSLV